MPKPDSEGSLPSVRTCSDQGATEQQHQEIAAEALTGVYFQDGGRSAGSLEEVRFTDIEHLEFDL